MYKQPSSHDSIREVKNSVLFLLFVYDLVEDISHYWVEVKYIKISEGNLNNFIHFWYEKAEMALSFLQIPSNATKKLTVYPTGVSTDACSTFRWHEM